MAELNEEMVDDRRSAFGHVLDEIVSIFNEERRKSAKIQRQDERIIKKILYFVWDYLIAGPLYYLFRAIVSIVTTSVGVTKQYVHFVRVLLRREKRWFIDMILYVLYIFTPFAFIIAPVGLCFLLISACVFVDQITYPHFTVDSRFQNEENKMNSMDRKSALIFEAATYQLQKELNSSFGWTPNDLIVSPVKFFDNRLNRQLGVQDSAATLVKFLSKRFTNYGHGDEENQLTYKAGQALSSPPDYWNGYMGDTEVVYQGALDKVNQYVSLANTANADKFSNIKNDDILAVLKLVAEEVLSVPLGRLQGRGRPLPWFELDNAVYYAQGAAINARNVLVALRSTYHDVLVKGSDDNLNFAIDALDEIINVNPWCVMRGNDRLMLLMDTRSKFATSYNVAIERLKDTIEAFKI